jgi:hypothetical protein
VPETKQTLSIAINHTISDNYTECICAHMYTYSHAHMHIQYHNKLAHTYSHSHYDHATASIRTASTSVIHSTYAHVGAENAYLMGVN